VLSYWTFKCIRNGTAARKNPARTDSKTNNRTTLMNDFVPGLATLLDIPSRSINNFYHSSMSFISSGEGIGQAEYGDPTYDVSNPPNTTFAGRCLRSFVPPSWIQKRTFETDVSWYISQPRDKLTKLAKTFFQDHTGIVNDDELIIHLCNIRNRAWNHKLSQYPYLGRWWFLRSIFALTPHYENVMEQARNGATILGVACGGGHELRYLKSAGTNDQIYAIDVQSKMWDLSLELFKDKDNPPATFIKAEVIRDDEEVLNPAFATLNPDFILLNRFIELVLVKSEENQL
jgi:hypothetical protein